MRLATFNLLHGRSVEDGVVDPDRLRRAVRRIDPDILCLQEVDYCQPRSHSLHLTRIAAEAAGAEHWRFEPTLLGVPGGAWRKPDGRRRAGHASSDAKVANPSAEQEAYGLGLVSRLPVEQWRVVRLPKAPMRAPVLIPGTRRPILLADEPRAALAAVLRTAEGPVTVVCTHLSFVPGWNAWQLRHLAAALRDLPDPLLVLGDLNLPGALPRLLTSWPQLARVATYPAWRPRVQFDHALDRSGRWQLAAVEAIRLPLSDHCALVVDADLPA